MASPVEKKVTYASAGAYLGSAGLLAILTAIQGDAGLVAPLPDPLEPFALGLIPAAITFVGGWYAKHTPRA
ncbi:holin [Streptomyces sp. NPDC018833]|uniref:holin n=1 Tax=Streptomyces sp. NPDC018833 TaxID=3365053 RepID=UPI0037B98653